MADAVTDAAPGPNEVSGGPVSPWPDEPVKTYTITKPTLFGKLVEELRKATGKDDLQVTAHHDADIPLPENVTSEQPMTVFVKDEDGLDDRTINETIKAHEAGDVASLSPQDDPAQLAAVTKVLDGQALDADEVDDVLRLILTRLGISAA